MSTALAPAPAPAPVPAAAAVRRPSLLRAELRRFRSRRLVQLLLLLGALVFAGVVALATTQFATSSPEVLAAATQQRQVVLDQSRGYREQCLAQPTPQGVPAGTPAEEYCGPPLTIEDLGPIDNFIDKRPFTLDSEGRAGLVAVAAATAGLAFLLGATYVGAEWSTRSMVALLFWEPRRLKVMATKLGVLVGVTAVLAVLAEGAWLLAARYLLATARGTTTVPNGTWGELYGSAGRGVLFVVLVGLLGFGIANLLRNTAASFGFAFVYFVIVENVLRGFRPGLRPYLLTENATALLTEGGQRIYTNEYFIDERGNYIDTGREILVSNLHGGLLLAGVVAAVVVLGVVLFARRDLN